MWWRKIQTADFGSHWNTCQFTHSVLSTRFRQLSCFFLSWPETQPGKGPKKKKKCNNKTFLLQANFANLKLPASSLALKDLFSSFPFLSLRCLPISYRVRSSSFIPNAYLSYSTPVRSPMVWSFSTSVKSLPSLSSNSSVSFPSATLTWQFNDPLLLLLIYWIIQFFCVCFLFSQHSAFAFLFVFPFCLMLFPWCIFLSSFDLSIFCN